MANNQYNSAPSPTKYQGTNNYGKVLKINSNGFVEPAEIGSGLPEVTTVDNGKVLLVNAGEWAASTLKVSDLTNDVGYLTSHQDISGKANSADLATVATSGSYTDLLNKPDLSVYLTSVPTMTGATSSAAGASGLVPAPATTDVDKFLAGDGTYKSGGLPMVILSYGSSTWAEFEAAYNNNVIVYCRASSNSNPASGSQTRMAFMAYVNNATTPTEVEFQYYRSMSAHSATAMGDQVFVYKLTKTSGWSVTTRDASIKQIKADTGTALGVSWSSNVVTLTNTMTAANMPMSSSDATKVGSAISTLSDQIANIKGVKSASYTLPASLTINGNESSTFNYSDFGIPNNSWILGGSVASYNDVNANALIFTTTVWYSTGYITLVNARSSAVTLSQGRVLTVYYA